MNIKLWLDDKRPMPDEYNVWCRDANSAMILLETGLVDRISFDHDLGSEFTGYTVANYIEALAQAHRIASMAWDVHSANPPGFKRINAAMTSAERFWNIWEGED